MLDIDFKRCDTRAEGNRCAGDGDINLFIEDMSVDTYAIFGTLDAENAVQRNAATYRFFLERFSTLSFNLVGSEQANGEILYIRGNIVKASEKAMNSFDFIQSRFYDIYDSTQL